MNITRRNTTKVKSSDYPSVLANYVVLVDDDASRSNPLVALLAEPVDSEPFLMPLDVRAARDLGLMLFDAVLAAAPALALEMLRGAGA